jgi:hypothetical protein
LIQVIFDRRGRSFVLLHSDANGVPPDFRVE